MRLSIKLILLDLYFTQGFICFLSYYKCLNKLNHLFLFFHIRYFKLHFNLSQFSLNEYKIYNIVYGGFKRKIINSL
jgi:hypothetical protein